MHTMKHAIKRNIKKIKFKETESETYVSSDFEDTQHIDLDTEIVGCNTSNMPKDDSQTEILRVVIPKPSTENIGHMLYIKDLDGGCGNDDGTTNSPNEIHIVHHITGTNYHHDHTIDTAYGFEILFSTGSEWVTFHYSMIT